MAANDGRAPDFTAPLAYGDGEATLWLSMGLTYRVVIGVDGALAALLTVAYRQFQTTTAV